MLLSPKNVFVVLIVFLINCMFVLPAVADNSTGLLKKVNKELRQAERDMFSGKTEQAIAALENIKSDIDKIKADDPNNPKLKSAENKFNKLVKDLERRTGKQLGGGTLSSEPASSATPMPAKSVAKELPSPKSQMNNEVSKQSLKSGTKKLPYDAKKPISNANRTLSSLQGNLDKLTDSGYSGNKDQLVKNLDEKINSVKESLNQAKQLAAKKGVNSHPDFDEVESKIAAAEKDIAAAKTGHEKNKAAVAASAKEVDADVAELKDLYDKVQQVFSVATGYVFQYNDLKTLEDAISKIENFEKNEMSLVKSAMKNFAAKYGSTKDEIDKKADEKGFVRKYYRASYPYSELAAGLENIGKTRDAMAEDLVRRTTAELDGINQGGADFSIMDRYQKVRNWLQMAVRYQPNNPKVKDLQNSIDNKITEGMKSFNTRIDSRSWPKHAANAPSNADDLAKASLEWFKNSPDWGKRSNEIRHPLAVVVTGPWSVQKKNLLGNPIMYGLPIKLAVRLDQDKALNVVRVYELTMRTIESTSAKMAPPFDHITVGNSYFIRPDKVK